MAVGATTASDNASVAGRQPGRQPGRRPPSLAVRLLIASLLVLLLALTLVGLAMDRAFQASALAAMQERLEATAFLVLAAVEIDAAGAPSIPDALAEARLDRPGSGLHAGAMTEFGSWQSPSLLGVPNPPAARVIDRGRELFRGPNEAGTWYVWALGLGWEQPDGTIIDLTIWAAEDPDRLRSATGSFRAGLWRWLVLAAGLILLAQSLVVALLMRPLLAVARQVGQVERGERARLSERFPRELEPLTSNLNALLDTERANAEQYQRALGDLAHALKTPLAVISARLSDREDPDSRAIMASVEDMRHRVRNDLDRAARSGRRTMLAPVAVAPVLERIAESLRKLYPACRFDLDLERGAAFQVEERDLMELAGNLMENAAKHGHGRVRASARSAGAGSDLVLVVDDDGPGMTRDVFERLVQRGVRGDERREGHGFGLSIVEQIVANYGGRLEVAESSLGGTRIRVTLPGRH